MENKVILWHPTIGEHHTIKQRIIKGMQIQPKLAPSEIVLTFFSPRLKKINRVLKKHSKANPWLKNYFEFPAMEFSFLE